MPRVQPSPEAKRHKPYERSEEALASTGRRRESAFQSLSRSISQVFSRAVRRPSETPADKSELLKTPDQEDSEASLGNATPETSETNVVPSTRLASMRQPPVPRKPSIDFSQLYRSQSNVSMPASVIVEAYRQALRERARLAERTPLDETLEMETGERPSAQSGSGATPHTSHHEKIEALPLLSGNASASPRGLAQSRKTKVTPSWHNNAAISKPKRKKPLRHRIQLVSKPMVDLGSIPDDRKHRPGFISANFDVSEDEDEPEPEDSGPPSASLLRRPQVASDKLKRAFETIESETPKLDENVRTEPSRPALPSGSGPGVVASTKPSFSFGQNTAGETPSQNTGIKGSSESLSKPVAAPPKPAFSFGGPSTSDTSTSAINSTDKPSFSFGSLPSAAPSSLSAATAASKENEKPAVSFGGLSSESKPSFSFGGWTPSAPGPTSIGASTDGDGKASSSEGPKKPLFSFNSGDSSNKDKPQFSFGAATSNKPSAKDLTFSFGANASSADSRSQSNTSGQTGEAPKFTFSSKPASNSDIGTETSSAPAASTQLNDANAQRPFVFGAKQTDSAEPNKPSFGFDAPQLPAQQASDSKPTFSFGAPSNSAASDSKPAVTFGAPSDKQAASRDGTPSLPPQDIAGGVAKPASSSAFAFGAPGKRGDEGTGSTPFVFGQSQKTRIEPSKPFQFGAAPSAPAAAADRPSFSFGASTSTGSGENGKSSVQVSSAPSGGNSSAPFTFGANAPTTSFGAPASGSASSTTAAAPFSFGKANGANNGLGSASNLNGTPDASNTTTPVTTGQAPFSFGANTTSGPPAQPFSFGQPQQQQASTGSFGQPPASGFQFGAPNGGSLATSFGQPQPSGAPSGSRESTPVAGGPIPGRKIAQVKKRLGRR